jgi:transcriptional regulator with GAF, ATPase, and Fis domain
MRRRSRASSKPTKARSRKAMPKRRNATTVRPRSSAGANQESEAARLASELSAMSEILRLISDSPSNTDTVLRSVAEQAAHICQAQFVDIFLVENDDLRDVAWFGELKRTQVFPLDRSTVAGRSVCEMRPVSIDDLQNAGDEFARGREIARKDGHRSILAVPLIREGRAIGTIVIRRTEIRSFEQKHISLMTTFAAQAVIAIENTRLLSSRRRHQKCCVSLARRPASWSRCSSPCWQTQRAFARRSLGRFIFTMERNFASAHYIMRRPPLPSFAGVNRSFIPRSGQASHMSSQQSGRFIRRT